MTDFFPQTAVIDFAREHVLTDREAAEFLKRGGKTLLRMYDSGLEWALVGKTRYTSKEAITRFSRQSNEQRPAPLPAPADWEGSERRLTQMVGART